MLFYLYNAQLITSLYVGDGFTLILSAFCLTSDTYVPTIALYIGRLNFSISILVLLTLSVSKNEN
jgi:hypothetical protein